jgi:hypothetical protein
MDIYWNILKMHGLINLKSPNNTSKWQMGFNSAFKDLNSTAVPPCADGGSELPLNSEKDCYIRSRIYPPQSLFLVEANTFKTYRSLILPVVLWA